MLAASLNAFFCASPIYGSAEDFTYLLDVTVSRDVTPAAKQQIGETRKKCNSDDRRLRRIQGGAVGAAVSRTRVPLKARSGRWAPQPVLAQRLAFFRFDYSFGIIKGEQPLIRASRASKVAGAFLVLFWHAKENFSFSLPPAQYSAVPHPTATRRECVPPAPSFSGGCGPASRGLPASGR